LEVEFRRRGRCRVAGKFTKRAVPLAGRALKQVVRTWIEHFTFELEIVVQELPTGRAVQR
jgi:hypothetical protein